MTWHEAIVQFFIGSLMVVWFGQAYKIWLVAWVVALMLRVLVWRPVSWVGGLVLSMPRKVLRWSWAGFGRMRDAGWPWPAKCTEAIGNGCLSVRKAPRLFCRWLWSRVAREVTDALAARPVVREAIGDECRGALRWAVKECAAMMDICSRLAVWLLEQEERVREWVVGGLEPVAL
ncbi:hypothetical protein GGR56DRAFT_669782 [Xylariaceae sp. FL0804]|nr:hypothetical protein GGR56DRAFT_669782 [Xylariaceae sp. FL0804]